MATVKRRGTGWQATYRGPDGRERTKTFRTKGDADGWVSEQVAAIGKGRWVDPSAGKVTLKRYSNRWLERRTDLAVRTSELYRHLLDRHVLPVLGDLSIAKISSSAVRDWHAGIAVDHPSTASKAYRLLSTIMRTAAVDDLIPRSPCQVKGAAVEKPAERPVASVAEVQALADAMPEHLRIAVLLAAWCQLRRGEVLGLRRKDVNLLKGTISVEVTRTRSMAGESVEKSPKTEAGRRSVSVPPNVLPDLEHHLNKRVASEPNAPVLVGEKGGAVTIGVLHTAWNKARKAVGRSDLRFHDLRHSGLTWSAATGASIAELMRRAGHASPVAALRYQHATEDRDRALADALAGLAASADITEIATAKPRSAESDADFSRTSAAVGE